MRKIIVCNIMSLDGYYEGPGKDVMVMPMGGVFDSYNAERLRAADTLLLGRSSFDMFRGFWPSVADDQTTDWSADNREISRHNNAIQKVVISDTLTPKQTPPWHNNTRIIKRADAHKQIADLKQQPGKDIIIFGSHILWNDLLANNLVDELHLMIGNVIVGVGTPIFVGKPEVSLRLLDIRKWDTSDNVIVKYEPHRKNA